MAWQIEWQESVIDAEQVKSLEKTETTKIKPKTEDNTISDIFNKVELTLKHAADSSSKKNMIHSIRLIFDEKSYQAFFCLKQDQKKKSEDEENAVNENPQLNTHAVLEFRERLIPLKTVFPCIHIQLDLSDLNNFPEEILAPFVNAIKCEVPMHTTQILANLLQNHPHIDTLQCYREENADEFEAWHLTVCDALAGTSIKNLSFKGVDASNFLQDELFKRIKEIGVDSLDLGLTSLARGLPSLMLHFLLKSMPQQTSQASVVSTEYEEIDETSGEKIIFTPATSPSFLPQQLDMYKKQDFEFLKHIASSIKQFKRVDLSENIIFSCLSLLNKELHKDHTGANLAPFTHELVKNCTLTDLNVCMVGLEYSEPKSRMEFLRGLFSLPFLKKLNLSNNGLLSTVLGDKDVRKPIFEDDLRIKLSTLKCSELSPGERKELVELIQRSDFESVELDNLKNFKLLHYTGDCQANECHACSKQQALDDFLGEKSIGFAAPIVSQYAGYVAKGNLTYKDGIIDTSILNDTDIQIVNTQGLQDNKIALK